MQLSGESSSAKYQIKKYTPGCITVNGQDCHTTILIMPEYFAEFNCQNFLKACAQKPDVMLLGTGTKLNMPYALINNKLGIEVMTTAAACRTYTILSAEHRNVMAVLQP